MEADEAPPPAPVSYVDVCTLAAPEAEQYWAPFAVPPPPSEEQVDEFLLGLPVEAIEHYVTTMEDRGDRTARREHACAGVLVPG
jgi:hypothetical protein